MSPAHNPCPFVGGAQARYVLDRSGTICVRLQMPVIRLRALCSVLLALVVCACAGEPDDRAAVPLAPDALSPRIEPSRPDSTATAVFAALVPDSLLVRRAACPFECCVYGEWALETGAPVRAAADTNAPATFTLAANRRFRADSGFVRITGRQLVAVHDTFDQRPFAALFVPGDTLLVLDYVGEGHYNVWTGVRVVEVEGFWGAGAARPTGTELLGRYEREWWVHVNADGSQGWLLVEPDMRLIGADACGTPPSWRSG
jgi:hypothetical protein